MPKTLKLALMLVFILAIFAPEALILAQEGSQDHETSYKPSQQQWAETIAKMPVRVLKYIQQAIPMTPGQWNNAANTLKDFFSVKNFKNFYNDIIPILGDIKNFFISVYHEFY